MVPVLWLDNQKEQLHVLLGLRQWHVAFTLMSVGLYMAETPNSRCLFWEDNLVQ